MITGYVSQVKPYKSTGDCVVSVEIVKEQWLTAATLNLEKVVVMTEVEYANLLDSTEDR